MGNRRILLIDDDDDIREVAAVSLEMTSEWDVLSASSGAEGLLLAETCRPDVILLDVMMPGMDGPNTLCALQNNAATRAIPVVFLTAKVQASDRQAYLDMGVRGVISKPFNPMTLAAQIVDVLSSRTD